MSMEDNDNVITKFLGYVAARVVSEQPPQRTDVLWAKFDGEVGGIKKYILHFWDGLQWVPINPGSSAGGVYDTLIPDGTEVPESVGGIEAGTLVDELRGKSFTFLYDMMLFPPQAPTYVQPEAILTGSSPKMFQVGDTANIQLTGSFLQNDAGSQTGYSLLKNGSPLTSSNPHLDANQSLSSIGSIVYQAIYDYAEGPIKTDYLGNSYPLGQIPSGNKYSNTEIYKWILPYYYGSSGGNTGIDILSGTKILAEIGTTLTVQFLSDGPKFYWLAVPAATPDFARYYITEISKGPIGAGNAWTPPVSVTVSDGHFANEAYDLYVTGYETQFNLPVKFET